MSATVYELFTATNLSSNATFSFEWKNIPTAKAYTVWARGYRIGDYYEGYNNTTQVQVTSVVHRRRSIQKQGSIGVDVEIHNDVLGTVKNVGAWGLDFTLYLVAFS